MLGEDETLFQLVFDVMRVALDTGVVLKRWEKVHQILLLKDVPESKIHRFRNITLVEADLMFVMRIVWAKDMATKIDKAGALNQAQYARKGQIDQMSVLNK